MQRLLKVVGALGLGLVIGAAAQADDHKKPTKQKQESNKQGSNKPTSESPGTGNTTPAGNATTAKNNSSGSATLSSGAGKEPKGIQWKLGGLAGGAQGTTAKAGVTNPLQKIPTI